MTYIKKIKKIFRWFMATWPRRILASFLLALFVFAPFSFLFFKTPVAEAAWWNDSWQYRKSIAVTNSTTDQANVYIQVTIDTSDTTRFKADCSDLRFTTANGELLPYYIVSGCRTASTVVNVSFHNLTANDSTIYYYYGNPNAAVAASPVNFTVPVAASYSVGSIGTEEKGTGPTAYWSFDEGQGTVAKDGTANKNNGTLTNMSATASSTSGWQSEDACVSGKCLAFDGGNDYVDAGTVTSANITDAITFELQLKPNSLAAGTKFLSRGRYQSNGWYIGPRTDGSIQLRAWSDAVNYEDFQSSAGKIAVNKWVFVTVVIKNGQYIDFYFDGIFDKRVTTSLVILGSASQHLFLGSYDGASEFFNGKIDEPKIYSYARTAAQIKLDYNVGLAGQGGSGSGNEGTGVSVGGKSDKWMSNGLVGYWKMDEATWNGTSGEVKDWSGNGNNGTAVGTTGGTASTTAGKFGNGGSFDGTDDYVNLGNPALLNFSTSRTFTAWVKGTYSGPGYYNIVGMANGTTVTNSWQIVAVSNGKVYYRQSDGSTSQIIFGNTNLVDGRWYHIAVSIDGAKVVVYLDGLVDKTGTGHNSFAQSSGVANIGRFPNTGAQYFPGTIDDVRIYNRALSDREVRDLYAWAPGPVGWWKMDEGSGQYAYDSSGQSNNGTLGAAATAGSDDPTWSQGKLGKGLKFDGVNDYAKTGAVFNIAQNGQSTFEAWVKFDQLASSRGARMGIYNFLDQHSANNYIYLTGTNAVVTQIILPNQWYHLALTYNGNTTSAKLYINGVPYNFSTSGENIPSVSTVYLGSPSGSNSYLDGSIDDVRIYNYARTQSQIIEDMNASAENTEGQGRSVTASGKTTVGYWDFDEGYGTTAHDSSPNKINAAISGASWSQNGKFGKALSFDGSTNVVTVTNSTAIDLNNNLADGFSVSAWVNPASAGENNNGQIFWKGANTYLRVGNLAGGRLDLGASVDLATDASATSSSAIATGAWSHIVMTYASSTQKTQIYVNGVLKTTSSAGVGPTATDANNLLIGGTTTNNFAGLIDDFKIYNYALTSDEVKLDYNKNSSMRLGSYSQSSTGVASSSAASIYCVPGSTDPCSPPVGEWKFEEGSGQTANDTSGNGNAGTLGSGATADSADPVYVTGKIGKALKFDGVNDYVDAGNSSILDLGTNNFTVSAWLKGTSNGWQGILAKANNEYLTLTSGWAVTISNGTNAIYFSYGNGANNNVNWAISPLIDGKWHLMTIVGTRSTAVITLYVDGKSKGDKNSANLTAANITDTSNFIIGSRFGGGARSFNGLIDGVAVYNYARTPAQIAWDYNKGAPVGWWKFDEGQGGIAHDASGNKNNGTIYPGAGGTQTATSTMWTNGASGKRNGSLNFDGTDDWVSQPTSISGAQSVGFWAYPTSNSQSFLQLTSGASVTSSNGTVSATGFTSPTVYINGKANGKVSANAWNHIVVTTGTAITANTIKLGLAGSTYYSGKLDDARIYNYALTPLQVKDIYNSGAIRFGL